MDAGSLVYILNTDAGMTGRVPIEESSSQLWIGQEYLATTASTPSPHFAMMTHTETHKVKPISVTRTATKSQDFLSHSE